MSEGWVEMPKDYFETPEVEEEVITEEEKHAKVIEFVYQVIIYDYNNRKRKFKCFFSLGHQKVL